MKPAREPVSSRPKPCASLKKPHASCPFAAPCGPRRKKNDRSQRSAFPSKTSRFALSILAHRGSAFPWLVNDRAALRLQIFCVLVVNPCNYFIELKPPVVCCTRFRPTTFFYFSPNEQCGRVGVCSQTFSFVVFSLFSRPRARLATTV